jgi:hypothetical protein
MSGLGKIISRAKLPLCGGLIILLLLVQSLAASPVLHHCFHDDASAPEHVCAVKTVAQGQLDLAPAGDFAPTMPDAILVQFLVAPPNLCSQFFCTTSSRVPPLA